MNCSRVTVYGIGTFSVGTLGDVATPALFGAFAVAFAFAGFAFLTSFLVVFADF